MKRIISLLLAVSLLLFSVGCAATRKYSIKDKKLPEIPCKIAVIDDGKGTAPVFKEILEETGSFEEVVLVKRKPSVEDMPFRQAVYDEGIPLLYEYEIIPVALDGAARFAEDVGTGLGTITRAAASLVGAVATAGVGGVGGTVTDKGLLRIWPYRSSQKVKLDFWVTDVYTGDVIYSNSAVTTGSAMHMGSALHGKDILTKDKASDIAMYNAFVKSTIDMIENISTKEDVFLRDDEE